MCQLWLNQWIMKWYTLINFIFYILVLKEKKNEKTKKSIISSTLSFLLSGCHTMKTILLRWASTGLFIAHSLLASVMRKVGLRTPSNLHTQMPFLSAMAQSHLGNRWHHSTKDTHSPMNSNRLCCHLLSVPLYQCCIGKDNTVE